MIASVWMTAMLLHAAPLTLEQAQAEARANGPVLKVAQAQADGARAVAAASGRYFTEAPELTAGYSPGALTGEPGRDDFDVEISQRFNLSGSWVSERRAAEAGRDEATASLNDAGRALDEQVAVAFAGLQFAQRHVESLRRAEELFRIAADAARRSLEVGNGNQLELDAAELDLAGARAQLASSAAEVESARAHLALLLGRRDSGELNAAESPLVLDIPGRSEFTHWVERDPRVIAADKAVERARSAREATVRSRWPGVTLGVGYSQQRFDVPAGAFSGVSGLSAEWSDQSLGLKLSVPIPVVDTVAQPVAEATAQQLMAQAQAAVVRGEIHAELSTRWSQLKAAVDVAAALEHTPEILERDYKLLSQAVRAGALDAVARAQSLRQLNDAAMRWDEARRQLAEARAHWEREIPVEQH